MLRVATSYFYQVRFFKPYMIPVSTAMWDPKWYHNFRDQDHCFVDKNGVINGLRILPLVPGSACNGLCMGIDDCPTQDWSSCDFLKVYTDQLNSIDFGKFMAQLEKHVNQVQHMLGFSEQPLVVILVHEKTDKLCSERGPLQTWFREHGLYVCELMYPVQNYY
ncbi:MAG: hypothetical protein NC548_10630 [Lachnospiraceae bacterium]|nr:hypothetical protein [Lachnospiraceae bacterium]